MRVEPQRKPLQKLRVNGIDLSVVQQHPLFRARGVIEKRRAESVQHESVQAPSQLAIHFLPACAVYRRLLSPPFPFSFPFPVSLLLWSFSSCCVVRLPETSLFLPPFAFPRSLPTPFPLSPGVPAGEEPLRIRKKLQMGGSSPIAVVESHFDGLEPLCDEVRCSRRIWSASSSSSKFSEEWQMHQRGQQRAVG